jgi:hypothetical protein
MNQRSILMRNLLLAGTAASLMMLGAVGTASADNPNVATSSPYAVMGGAPAPMPYSAPAYGQGYGYDQVPDDGMIEGRSAYIDPDYAYDEGPDYIDPGYGYYGGFGYGGYGGGFGRGGHFGGGHFGGGHFGGGHGGSGRTR